MDREQAQQKAGKRTGHGAGRASQAEHVAEQESRAAEKSCDGIELSALENSRGTSAEHVAQGTSADGSDQAEENAGENGEAVVEGASGSGNGEKSESGSIGEVDVACSKAAATAAPMRAMAM